MHSVSRIKNYVKTLHLDKDRNTLNVGINWGRFTLPQWISAELHMRFKPMEKLSIL